MNRTVELTLAKRCAPVRRGPKKVQIPPGPRHDAAVLPPLVGLGELTRSPLSNPVKRERG